MQLQEKLEVVREEELESDCLGPAVLKSEAEGAIKQMKVRKAEG